jgi:hypothetical protein
MKQNMGANGTILYSGVDVMINIFGGFCQFSAKILPFFSKNNLVNNFKKTNSI